MSKAIQLLLFAAGCYIAVQLNGGWDGVLNKNIADTLVPGNHVVMFSLTTCTYCKQKRQQMTAAGIPFTEYFLDTNPAKQEEFHALLSQNGVSPGAVGTPTFIVNGALLLNNPKLSEIKKRLRYKS